MSGEVQEPTLSFQAENLHSSSISFGRFEVDSLCWERRSSFSHNKYLEEVNKYAKPGSVTEKKAYFEAHFRKKALLRQASLESQVEKEGSLDNNSCITVDCDEISSGTWSPVQQLNQHDSKNDEFQFDKSSKSSCYDGDKRVLEINGNYERVLGELQEECVDYSVHGVENVGGICDQLPNDRHDIEARDVVNKQNSHCHSHVRKPTIGDKAKPLGAGLRYQSKVQPTQKTEVKKGSFNTSCDQKEKQVPLKTRIPKERSKSIGSSLQSSVEITKKGSPTSSKAKVQPENKMDKELRSKSVFTLQPSIPEKAKAIGNLSKVREKRAPSTNKEPEGCKMNSRNRFGKGKEICRNLSSQETKTPVHGNLNSKLTPKSPISNDMSRGSSRHKSPAILGGVRTCGVPSKSLYIGDRPAVVSKPQLETESNQANASPSTSKGLNVSWGRQKIEHKKTIGVRSSIKKDTMVHKEEDDGKRQELTNKCRQAVMERTNTKATQKTKVGKNANAILRKDKKV